MKTLVIIVSIFSAILLNVNGVAIVRQPIGIIGPIEGPICTQDVKVCTALEYLGTGPDGCPQCLPRQVGPIEGPICTQDVKVCTATQYLGTGPDGCPQCLPRFVVGPIRPKPIQPIIDPVIVTAVD